MTLVAVKRRRRRRRWRRRPPPVAVLTGLLCFLMFIMFKPSKLASAAAFNTSKGLQQRVKF
jgi:hypothetical protein